jgi:hypothetical protein
MHTHTYTYRTHPSAHSAGQKVYLYTAEDAEADIALANSRAQNTHMKLDDAAMDGISLDKQLTEGQFGGKIGGEKPSRYIYIYIYIRMQVFMYMCTWMCIHPLLNDCTHTHTHTYTHAHTHTHPLLNNCTHTHTHSLTHTHTHSHTHSLSLFRPSESLVVYSAAKPGQSVRVARKWLRHADPVSGERRYAHYAGSIGVLTR